MSSTAQSRTARPSRRWAPVVLAIVLAVPVVLAVPAEGSSPPPVVPACPPSWLGSSLTGHPTISANGRFVAFDMHSPDVDDWTNAVMLRDTRRKTTIAVALPNTGGLPYGPVISDRGNRVAYLRNRMLGERRAALYVYDRRTGLSTDEGLADSQSQLDLSADGRYLTYSSAGTDEGARTFTSDIYVRDVDTDITTLVSVSTSGQRANNNSLKPMISANGRYLLFGSQATDLPEGPEKTDHTGYALYLRDLRAHTTIALRNAGDHSLMDTYDWQLSPDGRYALWSDGQVHRYDRKTGRTVVIGPPLSEHLYLGQAVISGHGRYIAYQRGFQDTEDPEDWYMQLIVRDLRTGTEEQANVGLSANKPRTGAYFGAISPNGRFLTFYSDASDLVPNDTNENLDVFVRDLHRNRTIWASTPSPGPANCTTQLHNAAAPPSFPQPPPRPPVVGRRVQGVALARTAAS